MAKPKPTVWKAEDHTLAKHRILRELELTRFRGQVSA